MKNLHLNSYSNIIFTSMALLSIVLVLLFGTDPTRAAPSATASASALTPEKNVHTVYKHLNLHHCPCGRDRRLERSFWPVCGTDGITYGNKCEFDCYRRQLPNLELAKEGEC